ncbi:glycosyltransferase family 4 protein [Sandaracinus amylolyticus]|uniref:glycosyltransferase family 4 protein n=1 Tax=Sandaracinus amylolyticus TaxID=927083 RepID=UPI001F357830|nr:glycosyltransferase family 4 protein [Sandaracinus amylolyticus]UJR79239.1 Glycoside hydrolase [Sandaracinus amylolyticus]
MPATSFPTSERDVSGLFVLGMARALAARGHEIEVIAPAPDRGDPWTDPAPGVRVRWIDYARPRTLQRTFHRAGAPDNLARDPLAWIGAASFPIALAAAMSSRRWDAIASHWGVPCGLVAGAMRGAARHVAFFHSADVHVLSRAPRALARAIADRSDALVFVSERLRDRFLALAPDAHDRSHVIAMGVDPAPTLAMSRRERFTLLVLARLVPVKGLDRAIRAIATMPDVELVIGGEGPERARLEQTARALDANVRFLGIITGDEKARWLAAADALVAPSIVLPSGRTEGAPTALIEAMNAALPVIASDVGGARELVTHEHDGLLVPPDDVWALRAAIARLRDDPALRARLSDHASRSASSRTWSALAPRFEALLAQSSGECSPAHGSVRSTRTAGP